MASATDSLNTEAANSVHQPRKQNLPPPKIFLQETCAKHQFIRSRDLSGVYERPERLRAAYLGVSAAYSRIESAFSRMAGFSSQPPFEIIKSAATIKFDHLAVSYVHGQDNGVYLNNLSRWAAESKDKIAQGSVEIPDSLKDLEDDLYLCPQSVEAFQGGLGTVCEAIDTVASADEHSSRRAFVIIRPPGHHCGEDSPNGFCFVNGIAVAAAHAYIDHALRRVVIFDIDLHHGNGTQEIACQINSETWRDRHEKAGVQIFYGSIHDIASFPCEGDKPDMVADASKSMSGQDGQWLENIHLKPYIEETQFWSDYENRYRKLIVRATEFIQKTGGTDKDDVLVLMSCGFDASEYESLAMNRHGCKVPTGFYHRFTRDVCQFAEKYASGRVVSVMEGGYDDKAVVSGAMSHVCGLVDSGKGEVDPRWWNAYNVQQLEGQLKKRRGRKPHISHLEQWLQRTLQIAPLLSGQPSVSQQAVIPAPQPIEVATVVSHTHPDSPQPKKRGRPRKTQPSTTTPLSSASVAHTGSSVSGKKRGHTDEISNSSKQPRSSSYVSTASSSSVYTTSGYFSLPHTYASLSVTMNPAVSLRWQDPHTQQFLPIHSMVHAMPQVHLPTMPTPNRTQPDAAMDWEPTQSTIQPTITLVDLSRHWPKWQLTPGDISGATGAVYKCHTHFEPTLHAWGVRCMRGSLDQHYCYLPNRYKNALRFLNYRIAQLGLAAETSFHLPRKAASTTQRQQIRDLRNSVQRTLVFHHHVRETVFKEIRDRCYSGRDPGTAKPSGPMAVRLPSLDTWLLHEYAIGEAGPGLFDTKKLQELLAKHDPLELDWREWANTSAREQTYGFDFPPTDKDIAMHQEAGIPINPVVEGITVKADWYKKVIDEQIKEIRATI